MAKRNKKTSNISKYGKMVSIASYFTICELFWKGLSEFDQMAFKGYAATSKESFLSAFNTEIGNELMERIITLSKTFNWKSKIGKRWERSAKIQVDFIIERFYEFCLDRSDTSFFKFWQSRVTTESIPDLVFKPETYLKHWAKNIKKEGNIKNFLAELSHDTVKKNLPEFFKSYSFKNCLRFGLLNKKELEEYLFHIARLARQALKNA